LPKLSLLYIITLSKADFCEARWSSLMSKVLCVAMAAGAVLGASSPAFAFSISEMPRNGDGSARFADPDAGIEAQQDAYLNGRRAGPSFGFGDGAPVERRVARVEHESRAERQARRNHECVECASVYVDGLWLLRPSQPAE
jgi:hypothetical protein